MILLDFGRIFNNKWDLHAMYYWLTPEDYEYIKELYPDIDDYFTINDDGNYYAKSLSEELEGILLDEDLLNDWECINSTQGATGQ